MAPSHWLAVFTPATWQDFVAMGDLQQLGFGALAFKKLKTVKVGDIFVAYVCRAKKLGGIYEVVGEYNRDGASVWNSTKFPFCLPVKAVSQFNLDDAPFFLDVSKTQSWYRKLPNKKYWSFAFRNPPRVLKQTDGIALVEAILERAKHVNQNGQTK
jgi:hypothetical protein